MLYLSQLQDAVFTSTLEQTVLRCAVVCVVQRAKLLLTLKAMSVSPAKGTPAGISLMATCTHGQAQEAKVSPPQYKMILPMNVVTGAFKRNTYTPCFFSFVAL